MLVEGVAGEPYERFVRRRLLAPAGMTDSGFEGEPLPRGAVLAREYAGPPDEQHPVAPRPYRWGRRASLGLVTTAEDLYRLLHGMRSDGVLPADVRRRMLTPRVATSYRTLQGYGWDLQRINGARVERRLAGTPGFEGELLRNLDEGWEAVILVNTQVGWRYAVWDEISAAVRGAPSAPLDSVIARLRHAPYLGGRPVPVRPVESVAP